MKNETKAIGGALVMAGCLIQAMAAPSLEYPPARRGDVVDDYHGVKVADPYRWLEDLDSPETAAWVTAEAKVTDAYLDKIPGREAIKHRLAELLDFEKFGIPFHEGSRYFYSHNTGLQQQSILYATAGLDGAPSIALDPNLISTNGSLAVVGHVVNRSGTMLAYGISHGGSDWTEWRLRDLASGLDLPDVLRWTKYYHPIFSRDGKGIYYSAFPAPAPGEELRVRDLHDAVFYHALGTSQSEDRRLYERPDHPDWQFEPHLTPDGRWLVICAGEGEVGDKGLENVYALDLNSPGRAPFPMAEGFDAEYIYAGADGGRVYFQTTLEAPRGRVIAMDPLSPQRSSWKEAVPQSADSMDVAYGSVTLVDHQLIVRTLHDVSSRVSIYGLDGQSRRELTLPGRGTAGGFSGEPDDKETFYSYTDPITPPTIYRLDLESGQTSVYRAPEAKFDRDAFEVEQVFYPSKDGTRIPMFLVHKKGMKRNGTNPTILYGYGGFGISTLPHFDATRMLWLERGGIFASANIRGGGEYGEAWHRQAIRARKQIVFDDFIAAAEWLIAQHYTSTPKLAIEGGSNGGLLVGACLTQRPSLYGAVLAYVGVMDMLRFDLFGQGAGWVGDFGSSRNADDFQYLYAYSPYHNVHAGTHYPATLVITGDHDARVMPAHSFKFAAALQAGQAGPAPVLLRVRRSTGHGAGPTTSQLIEEKADAYAFLFENLSVR
ncbi:MAG TPA: prolyl oligopeptidase family serine peptidase [Verrucomicrobiae bacterium]|jgi:prolyl oligopeptidase